MKKIVDWIRGHVMFLLVIDIIVALVLGIYFPEIFSFLKKYTLLVSFLMIYPIIITTDLLSFKKDFGNRKFIFLSLFYHFLISPLILFLILKIGIHDPLIAAGLMFIAIMPSSGMAIVWTKLYDGTVKLSIIVLAITLITAMIIIPIETHYIIGHFVNIPMKILINSILILLFLPIIFGYLTRIYLIKLKGEDKFNQAKPYIGVISTIALLTIIFIAFGLKGSVLLTNPLLVLKISLPMLLYYLIGFTLMTWIGIKSKFSFEDIIALNYSSVTKNRSMALAIAITILDPLSVTAIALAGVLAQTPMMVAYGKISHKILNKYLKY